MIKLFFLGFKTTFFWGFLKQRFLCNFPVFFVFAFNFGFAGMSTEIGLAVPGSNTDDGSGEPEYVEKDPTGRYVRVLFFHNYEHFVVVV